MPPMPIISHTIGKYMEPELWRMRKINTKLNTESDTRHVFGGAEQDDTKLKTTIDKLQNHAESIGVRQQCPIAIEDYPGLFKYKVYECFKPRTLSTARQYIKHLVFGSLQAD